jgi:hypothetical protein
MRRREGIAEYPASLHERVVDDQQIRTAILKGIPVLCDAPPDVKRHDGGAYPSYREMEFKIATAVQHQDRDPVALTDSKPGNCAGRAADPLANFGPRPFSLAFQDRDPLRIDLKRPPKPMRNVHLSSFNLEDVSKKWKNIPNILMA